jgi:hypothetical protein
MLDNLRLTADELKADIRSRVVFIVDRLLVGSPERAIQSDILRVCGPYPPKITYSMLQEPVEAELATRKVPRSQISKELFYYQKLRHLALAVNTRIKATERLHRLLGIQTPSDAVNLGNQLQMSPVKSYKETADDLELMIQDLKRVISEEEAKSTKPAEPSDPQLCEAAG